MANPTGQFSVCSLRALEGLCWQQQDAIRSCGLRPKDPSLGQGGEAIQNVVSSLLLLTNSNIHSDIMTAPIRLKQRKNSDGINLVVGMETSLAVPAVIFLHPPRGW